MDVTSPLALAEGLPLLIGAPIEAVRTTFVRFLSDFLDQTLHPTDDVVHTIAHKEFSLGFQASELISAHCPEMTSGTILTGQCQRFLPSE